LQLVWCPISVNLTLSTVIINNCTKHASIVQHRTASIPPALSLHYKPSAGNWECVTEDGFDTWTSYKVTASVEMNGKSRSKMCAGVAQSVY
jgi:hypothetical protein